MTFDIAVIVQNRQAFFDGMVMTALISIATLILSFGFGIGVALARVSSSRVLRLAGAVYVDIFRNTPFVVQLFFLYFGLPEIGFMLGPIETGILALSLATAASNGEVLRAGIESVDRGVVEAATASALSKAALFTLVVFPIALRASWRPLGNIFVNMVLTTSVLSMITVNDLMGNANTVSSTTFRPFEVYLTVLVLYCAMTFVVAAMIGVVQKLWVDRGVRPA